MPNLINHSEGLMEGQQDLVQSTKSSGYNVYEGTRMVVVLNARARLVKALACFPTGVLGSELSESLSTSPL
jgi:hypothetical protein